MIRFFTQNKKALLIASLIFSLCFTTMGFFALPFLKGPAPTDQEIVVVLLLIWIACPLFFFILLYVKWLIFIRKFNENIVYPPYRFFFEKYGFKEEWLDVNQSFKISEKGMTGSLHNKAIICRIDENNTSRLNFIIHSCEAVISKKSKISFRNPFNLEEPVFYKGRIYKSFNKTKTLTTEIIYDELSELIRKYN